MHNKVYLLFLVFVFLRQGLIWPKVVQNFSIALDALEFITLCLYLPSAGTASICHYTWPF